MKVLVVKTSSMGDVIHTMPAVTEALRHRPDLVLDWCVEAPFAPLVRLHPGVHEVHEVELRRWRRRPWSAAVWHAIAALRERLRSRHYDLVIDAQGLLKSVWIARAARAPIAGFDRRSAREPLAALAYRDRYAAPWDIHAVPRLLRLFAGSLGYACDDSAIDCGLKRPAAATGGARVAFLLHGTQWPSKRWTTPQWCDIACRLEARGFTPALTWSNADEESLAREVARAAPSTRLIAPTTLDHLADDIAGAALVIGCDTGLTHLAAAFGLPVVGLFLSTAPGLTGPVGPRALTLTAHLDCAPCLARHCRRVPRGETAPCTTTLTVDAVLEAAQRALERVPSLRINRA